MSYDINWSKKADKFLEKLPKDISKRIVHKVNLIEVRLVGHRGTIYNRM